MMNTMSRKFKNFRTLIFSSTYGTFSLSPLVLYVMNIITEDPKVVFEVALLFQMN